MMLGIYRAGDSLVHHTPAGVKLLLLAVAAVAIVAASFAGVVLAAVLVAGLWHLSGLGRRELAGCLKPLTLIFLAVLIFHGLIDTWSAGLIAVAKIAMLVALAALVSLTTRVTDMLDAFVAALKPLRPIGVNAEAVGFLAVLAIRFVPALFRIADEVRAAQRARGLEDSVIAVAVPLLLRTLKEGDAVADALEARGWTPK